MKYKLFIEYYNYLNIFNRIKTNILIRVKVLEAN